MGWPNHGFTSPLRYPGGKGMLANFMKLVMLQNDLLDGHYVEVYAGGAALAWTLLFDGFVRHVHLNDVNKSLYAFWRSVLEDTDDLCKLVRDTPVTIDEWQRQKAIQSDPDNHSTLQLGFSTFFLNRTNRSGIVTGGVIGGKAQQGKWKLDARFNKPDLLARIQRIACHAEKVSIYGRDAAEFITQVVPTLPDKTLVYLDPPYHSKGKDLYQNRYTGEDHVEIANLVHGHLRHPWIVSYDAAPEVVQLYSEFQSMRYGLSYSAQSRYVGSEIMFFCRSLSVPKVSHPAQVRLADSSQLPSQRNPCTVSCQDSAELHL